MVHGQVSLRTPGGEEVQQVARGAGIAAGDVLTSGAGGSVQMTLDDDSVVSLVSFSSVRINQFSFDRKINRRTAVVRVLQGKVRVTVFKVRSLESNLSVESDTAAITIDNLGDCVIHSVRGASEVAVLEQTVRVRNVLSYVVGDVRADANQKVTVRERQPPSAPATLSSDERRRCLHEFIVR